MSRVNASDTSSGAALKDQGESLMTFLASLTSSGLILAIGGIIYMILKFKFPKYYYNRAHQIFDDKWAPIPLSPGVLVMPPEFRQKHESGLENYLFDRYLYTLTRLFLLLSLMILPILIPINLTDGKNRLGGVNGLDRLSFSNVSLSHTNRYWAHFTLALLSTIFICYILQNELLESERLEQSLIDTKRVPYQKSSLLVISESKVPLSYKIISHQFRGLFGGVLDVTMNRDYSLLRSKLKERDECAGKLEIAETRLALAANRQSSGEDYNPFPWPSKPVMRPTIRLPLLDWLPPLPFFGPRIDAIRYLRLEFIRYSLEIEQHQQHPNEFPQLNSAFVYFKKRISMPLANLAIEARIPTYWTLKHRTTSKDTIWENISLTWWQRFFRILFSCFLISALILGYVVPVALIGSLSQIGYLANVISWLTWLNKFPNWLTAGIQGILPPLILAILTAMIPSLFRFLTNLQGNFSYQTSETQVQTYYFLFLFVQEFLTISLSAGITTIIGEVKTIEGISAVLARNLPKACNYFFSYILIHTISTVVSTLVQIEGLVSLYILSQMFDKTGRQIWQRQHNLQIQKWGTFLPKFTNIACIGFIYSVIAPLILPINTIYFGTLWLLYRSYPPNLLDLGFETKGEFYSTAIHQLFIGIYFMQLCLSGLFYLVRDIDNTATCITQASLMIFMFCLTGIFQLTLNRQYQPLDNTDTNNKEIENERIADCVQNNIVIAERPTLWIPKSSGACPEKVFGSVSISNIGVFFDKRGKLSIEGSPPSVIRC